ncbi:hypothetical protein KIN20_007690 [Parelaphostrongylus tenuis]|uniref:Uncharacterized protein n=1 Tax=Parelaphostrongylus tenuis TaxID=148309 RepID=A0AAD5M5T7_PARTN|nr:hypothetical protein KIN20_007690 [Parelaphostrongylus tenuis]
MADGRICPIGGLSLGAPSRPSIVTGTTTKTTLLEQKNSTFTVSSTPSALSTTSSSAAPMTSTEKNSLMTGTFAPVWAVGLAVVIAVACVGLNLGLLSAYICYRRQNSHKHSAQIFANKGPRLHAYNPTI